MDAGLIVQRPLYIGLTSGLVGYWSFDGPDMAGVKAYDRSGQGNNGTLTNGPARRAGRIGQALEFDGSNDFVNAGSGTSLDDLDTKGGLTVSAWIKPDTLGAVDQGRIVTKDTSVSVGRWEFRIYGDSNLMFFKDYPTTDLQKASAVNTIRLGEWQHMVATWDGSDSASGVRLYINGVEPSSYSLSINPSGTKPSDNTLPLVIGDRQSGSRTFDGLIDEVRVYNRALSPDEIKRLYKIGATLKLGKPVAAGLDNGLVGYWTFDGPDMAGNTAYDRSGQNNTGTLTNGPVRRAGRIGQALEFDGSDDYVDAGSDASLDNLPAFTWSAWTYPKGQPGNAVGIIIGKRSGINEKLFQFGSLTSSTPRRVTFSIDAATTDAKSESPNNTYNLNVWEHWTATYDDNGDRIIRIYKNGQEITYLTQTAAVGALTSDASQTLKISDSFYVFNGLIDEVRVYNRVLSPDEIKRLYKIGATLKLGKPVAAGLDNGLVGYWSFDGPDMAGVKAFDRSGQGNTGTLTNGPVRRAGRIGQALSFDGVDALVDAGSAAILDNMPAVSVSAWIYPRTEGETGNGYIIAKRSGSTDGSGEWEFKLDGPLGGTKDDFIFTKNYVTTDLQVITSNNTISYNTWQHMVLTWDGTANASGVRIYKNGIELSYQTQQNGVGAVNSDAALPLVIANRQNATRAFDGLIDDVRVYNRALSPDEIKRLYQMGR